MAVLKEEAHSNISLVAAATVLSYTNATGRDLAVLAKVELGDAMRPIAGGGQYQLSVLVENVPVLPSSTINVPVDSDYVAMQSRHLSLQSGQTIVIQALGLAGDTNVNTEAALLDVTPALLTDLTGAGSIPVDHNYGDTDNLRIVDPDGAGIQDATISAYLESDYDAGNYTASFLKGRTTTNVNGRWRTPISLDPGDYVLVVAKPGEYETEASVITVEA